MSTQNNTYKDAASVAISLKKRDGRYQMRDLLANRHSYDKLPTFLKKEVEDSFFMYDFEDDDEKYKEEIGKIFVPFTSNKSVAYCGLPISYIRGGDGNDTVEVKLRQMITADNNYMANRASVSGVQHCGAVWCCPVCSARVSAQRQKDLEHLFNEHLARGKRLGFLTLTMRHTLRHDLEFLFDSLSAAWQFTTNGGGWKIDRAVYGVEHYVRVLEITRSKKHGWHLHAHVVLFMEDSADRQDSFYTGKDKFGNARYRDRSPEEYELYQDLDALGARMFARWKKKLSTIGKGGLTPSDAGMDIREVTPLLKEHPELVSATVAGYLAKSGLHHEFRTNELLAAEGITPAVAAQAAADAGQVMGEAIGIAQEVTGSQNKVAAHGSRTPWKILEDFRDSYYTPNARTNYKDLELWREYEKASKGKRQIVYSRGLRAEYGLAAPASDEQVANTDMGEVVLCEIGLRTYHNILRKHGLVELLRAAESDGDDGVNEVLRYYKQKTSIRPVDASAVEIKAGVVTVRDPRTNIPYVLTDEVFTFFDNVMKSLLHGGGGFPDPTHYNVSTIQKAIRMMKAAGVPEFAGPVPSDVELQDTYGEFTFYQIHCLRELEKAHMERLEEAGLEYGTEENPLLYPTPSAIHEELDRLVPIL